MREKLLKDGEYFVLQIMSKSDMMKKVQRRSRKLLTSKGFWVKISFVSLSAAT